MNCAALCNTYKVRLAAVDVTGLILSQSGPRQGGKCIADDDNNTEPCNGSRIDISVIQSWSSLGRPEIGPIIFQVTYLTIFHERVENITVIAGPAQY